MNGFSPNFQESVRFEFCLNWIIWYLTQKPLILTTSQNLWNCKGLIIFFVHCYKNYYCCQPIFARACWITMCFAQKICILYNGIAKQGKLLLCSTQKFEICFDHIFSTFSPGTWHWPFHPYPSSVQEWEPCVWLTAVQGRTPRPGILYILSTGRGAWVSWQVRANQITGTESADR